MPNPPAPRPLPAGAAGGTGKTCRKWAIHLWQKVKNGKYSPVGDQQGMGGVPFTVNAKTGRLNSEGKSQVYTGTVPSDADVLFGLTILPDFTTIDPSTFVLSRNEVDDLVGNRWYREEQPDKCAGRLALALNGAADGKYMQTRTHKIAAHLDLFKKNRTLGTKSGDRIFFSTLDGCTYLDNLYPEAPKLTADLQGGTVPLASVYGEYGSLPKSFYFLKASFAPSAAGATPAVGHMDLSEGPGARHLDRYSEIEYNPSALTLWIFTEVIFVGVKTEGDVCVLEFEHRHVP